MECFQEFQRRLMHMDDPAMRVLSLVGKQLGSTYVTYPIFKVTKKNIKKIKKKVESFFILEFKYKLYRLHF